MWEIFLSPSPFVYFCRRFFWGQKYAGLAELFICGWVDGWGGGCWAGRFLCFPFPLTDKWGGGRRRKTLLAIIIIAKVIIIIAMVIIIIMNQQISNSERLSQTKFIDPHEFAKCDFCFWETLREGFRNPRHGICLLGGYLHPPSGRNSKKILPKTAFFAQKHYF